MRFLVQFFAFMALTSPVTLAGSPKASSMLRDNDGVYHKASNAFDGLLQTGWSEGVDGMGDGSWLELPLDRPVEISSVSVWPGNLVQGSRSLREFSRPRTVTITLYLTDGSQVVEEKRLQDGVQVGPKRVDIPIKGKARKVRVTINDSFEGGVFTDVFISEVAINFTKGGNPRIVEKLKAWQDSSTGKRAMARNKDEIVELYEAISSAEFCDSAALQKIMDRAGDGAPYLRDRVRRLVPAGYRVQALPARPCCN